MATPVLTNARALNSSIVARVENLRRGPIVFQAMMDSLAHLERMFKEVETLIGKFPDALPPDVRPLCSSILDRVIGSLRVAVETVETDFSKAFSINRTVLGGLKRKSYRFFRAKALNAKFYVVETHISKASLELAHLTAMLSAALKFDSFRNEMSAKEKSFIDDMSAKEERLTAMFSAALNVDSFGNEVSAKEEYIPIDYTPAVSFAVHLDFATKDAQGNFVTPEGVLKHEVLSSASSAKVVAGALKTYAVVGMAGVGKTIALLGLALDGDIRARFPDGIHYLSFGPDSTVQDAIAEIALPMRMTGATASVAMVEKSTSVKEAIANALAWFRDKKCLFLIDDLWPTDESPTGFLTDLLQLLRGSPDSRMALSTRSVKIAHRAESVVDFGARDPLGAVSWNIFMKYAQNFTSARGAPDVDGALRQSVTKILARCAGLPIALSVSGSAVAFLVRSVGTFETACEIYAADFEARPTKLGHERDPDGSSLNDGIFLSLKYLQVEFMRWKETTAVDTKRTIRDLYASLCVLTQQLWIPISVLSRMWDLDDNSALDIANLFCGMSLATLSFLKIGDGAETPGLTLHDLHLEFCQQQGKSNLLESVWHASLLNGYLASSSDALCCDPCALSSSAVVGLAPRPWWSAAIEDDGYIHGQLGRHLSLCGGGSADGCFIGLEVDECTG